MSGGSPKSAPVIIQITNRAKRDEKRYIRELDGKTILEYMASRIQAGYDGEILVATTVCEEDNVFEVLSRKLGIKVYRGSYINVPERLMGAVNILNCDSFIKVHGNHPLVSIERMSQMLEAHIEGAYDYSYNGHVYGDIWGTDCEIMSRECLKKIIDLNLSNDKLDEFSFIIRQNSDMFNVLKFQNEARSKRPVYKLAYENLDDFRLIDDIVKNVGILDNGHILEYLKNHPILAKSNHQAPSKEVGVDKLYLHTGKLKNVLSLRENNVDFSYPISVELSLTNNCNLKCVYCSDEQLRSRQGKGTSLQKEVLFRLFDDLARNGTQGVVIEGGGEPTLHPDFEDIVKYARNAGLAAGLITNGTMRLSSSILNEFEWIRVSLDATTAKEFSDIKQADAFEKVIGNISHYKKYCETVGVGFVVTNNNISELETLVMRLREHDVSYIQLRPVVDCGELYPHGEDLSYLLYYQTSRFSVIIDGMSENTDSGNYGIPCRCHSLTSVIAADGSVFLCGRLNIYKWLEPIGNINESSFRNIWHGAKRIEQAELAANAEFCAQNCPQCRISKFNKQLDSLLRIKSKHFI